MKKIIVCTLVMLTACFCAIAGDAAVFYDIGFSEDGKTYIFGQYGKTDKEYQAWAEIYTVDVANNVFIKSDVYKTAPSKDTVSISGRTAFDQLYAKAEWKLSKYNCKSSDPSTLLYIKQDEKKSSTEEIVFKDFEGSNAESSVFYHVKLVPTYNGKGKNCKSSFYIDLKKKDEDNNLIASYKVGTPDFKRDGITSYSIEKIFTDKSGKNLVFIVQKILEDDTGSSVRYMVETVSFK